MKTQHITKITLFLAFFVFFNNGYAQKASKVQLPSNYEFNYIYKLKMTHKKGDMTFDYYLKEGAKYFGFDSAEMSKANPDAKVFMVMDNDLGITAMFMEMMGKKVVQKTKLKGSDFKDDTDNSKYNFSKIDSKTILGYACEGFVSENDEVKITFYITDEVPVSFNQVWGVNKKNIPKGFNPAWMKKYEDNGLMMEMIFVDKKKSKNNMTMQCTGLDKTDFSIDTSKYGSMMSAFGG
ncbi:DUF4412 domain-containing protein [uncultured Psychroserpens sp.]|uniref:DUF4412 domain-containing protein n=1 Tax=uncultured Psychroserpens sp. TaxID=255436 RepID=UPI002627F6E1|nr:DUF4412 domain-containing protein [uncultured Psychroserpens sp.]